VIKYNSAKYGFIACEERIKSENLGAWPQRSGPRAENAQGVLLFLLRLLKILNML
jgi:hypothetical protein